MTNKDKQTNAIQGLLSDIDEQLSTYCMAENIIPITITLDVLTVATVEPLSAQQQATLRFISHRQIVNEIWTKKAFESAQQEMARYMMPIANTSTRLQKEIAHQNGNLIDDGYFQNQRQASNMLDNKSEQHEVETKSGVYKLNHHSNEPIIHFINQVLQQALLKKASDIHIEPFGSRYRIRQRIDGVLYDMALPSSLALSRLIVRIKVMAELDIAEKRLPQDGQLTLLVADKHYALRVSVLPVIGGEKIVLRIIEAAKQLITIEQLGMTMQQQQDYLTALNLPQGVILVTGPTGSGKTVTLYSGMQWLNQASRNICTIEDPVEIKQQGINQTQINNKIGLSFSHTLRALLRQDPDVIMVGEIRDHETANIAMEAGQTGHLVLSTLHTNSTIDTLVRLKQMGIADYLLVSGLNLIISQRLVRRLCAYCKKRTTIKLASYDNASRLCQPYWQEVGCNACTDGYHGRTAIYELLPMTTDIRQALLENVSTRQLKQLALQLGMMTLYQSAMEKLAEGITSLSEIERVLGRVTKEI